MMLGPVAASPSFLRAVQVPRKFVQEVVTQSAPTEAKAAAALQNLDASVGWAPLADGSPLAGSEAAPLQQVLAGVAGTKGMPRSVRDALGTSLGELQEGSRLVPLTSLTSGGQHSGFGATQEQLGAIRAGLQAAGSDVVLGPGVKATGATLPKTDPGYGPIAWAPQAALERAGIDFSALGAPAAAAAPSPGTRHTGHARRAGAVAATVLGVGAVASAGVVGTRYALDLLQRPTGAGVEPGPAARDAAPPNVDTPPDAAPTARRTADSNESTTSRHAEPQSLHQPVPDKPLAGRRIVLDAGHNGGDSTIEEKPTPPAGTPWYRPDAEEGAQYFYGEGQWSGYQTSGTHNADGELQEAQFTMDMTLELERQLEDLGAEVVLTRTPDTPSGPSITERALMGNDANAWLAVSLHGDGTEDGAGHGYAVLAPALEATNPGTLPGVEEMDQATRSKSDELARHVRHGLDGLDDPDVDRSNYLGQRGLAYRSDLGGLNLSTIPKVYVELANMRNDAVEGDNTAPDSDLVQDPEHRAKLAKGIADGLVRMAQAED